MSLKPTRSHPDVVKPFAVTREPDLIDRMFDYLVEVEPRLQPRMEEIKEMLRGEFGGEGVYVRKTMKPSERTAEVLRLFNGKNATEVARRLGTSRGAVWRTFKQAGKSQP